MTLLADLLSTVFERRYRRGAGQDDRPMDELCRDLLTSRGEVSGVALAREVLDRYAEMDAAARLDWFRFLATEMDIDPELVAQCLHAYQVTPSRSSYRDFMAAAEPPRQELARRLNQVPGATARLVAMRADLLRFAREEPLLEKLDLDIRHLFKSWFNRGFLVLRPINWESPAHILEKIIAYEAVHAIDSWDDLRRRLQPDDRRCFGFFHPAMPDEPLIFVEVALTKGIPNSIQGVLAEERAPLAAEDADTAVFYSISNCQPGLAGISFGNSLIKQVVRDLSTELQGLQRFVTLSPIPGLMAWLTETNQTGDVAEPDRLKALAAAYLLTAKRPNGQPQDPVARFHLMNGALVHAVHASADTSENGVRQSGGAMVNYLYDLERIAQNHEAFATRQEVVASSDVTALAKTV